MAGPDFEPRKYREPQPPTPKTMEGRIEDELGGVIGKTIIRDVELFPPHRRSDGSTVIVTVYTRLQEKEVDKTTIDGTTTEVHRETIPLRRAIMVEDADAGRSVLVDRPGDGQRVVFLTAAGINEARGKKIDNQVRPWKALTAAARSAWIFSAGTATAVSGFMVANEKPGLALTAAAVGAAVAVPSGAVDFATSRFTRAKRRLADAYARRSDAVKRKMAMVLPK